MIFQQLEQRIRVLEEALRDSQYDMRHVVRSELRTSSRMDLPLSFTPQLFSALCVNTIDPMAEGQVQFFTPMLTEPGTQVGGLPWAYPISSFGGFDDCGVTWVPPAGSKLALLCENGDKNQIYYIGTFHPRTRGKAVPSDASSGQIPSQEGSRDNIWGCTIPEYQCLWEGSRCGYNLGPNDGSQVKIPWNTELYNTKDWDSQTDFISNPNANQYITYPYIYGFKTPEKHYLKFVDGDHKCNHRWRRVELATGCCNILIMKDDHLHPAGQWAYNGTLNSDLACSDSGDEENTIDDSKITECYDAADDPGQDCVDTLDPTDCDALNKQREEKQKQTAASGETGTSSPFANPYYKRKEEMRLYKAPDSLEKYQNPKCELPQSGIQMQSISGMQLVMDDSVDQPQGEPRWNRDWDWGCNDVFKGKMFLRTTTGHVVEMNDEEDDTHIRSVNNGIKLVTAYGNSIKLIDHTLGSKENPDKAGDKRGVFIQSTANHVLEFHDEGNEQKAEPRKEGGEPEALADQAYILLRSGYGLQLRMDDSTDQQSTQEQYVQLLSPQRDNIDDNGTQRGPHQLVMQERAEGPGLVMLRAGGVYYRSSFDSAIEVVGDENNPDPSDKFVQVTGSYIVDAGNYYFNHNQLTIFQAEEYIILFAGRDCPEPVDAQAAQSASQSASKNAQIAAQSQAAGIPNEVPLDKGPCLFPVLLGKSPWVCPLTGFIHYGIYPSPADPGKLLNNSLSDRVFASSSNITEQ